MNNNYNIPELQSPFEQLREVDADGKEWWNSRKLARVQHELAAMGWHSITIWECELKPKVREKTLESLAFTLNKIFLQDHSIKHYEIPEEEPLMAAEDMPTVYENKVTDKTL